MPPVVVGGTAAAVDGPVEPEALTRPSREAPAAVDDGGASGAEAGANLDPRSANIPSRLEPIFEAAVTPPPPPGAVEAVDEATADEAKRGADETPVPPWSYCAQGAAIRKLS